MRSSVPENFPEPVVVVRPGGDLLAAIRSA
jgi:hypothetical protein